MTTTVTWPRPCDIVTGATCAKCGKARPMEDRERRAIALLAAFDAATGQPISEGWSDCNEAARRGWLAVADAARLDAIDHAAAVAAPLRARIAELEDELKKGGA